MMKVGIDIHAIGMRQTGNETYIRNLVENLAALGLPLDYVFYHTLPPEVYAEFTWKTGLRRLRPHNPLVRIPLGFPLVLLRDRIDLAHFQYVAPPLCPCPTVVTVHDISFELFPENFHPLERKRMQWLVPFSARKAAHVITVSEFSRRAIMQRYGVPEQRISVTHEGVSDNFRQARDAAWVASRTARFGLAKPYVLGVGNLQPRKNLERLLKAFARLRGAGVAWDLVLVGQTAWHGQRVHALVRDLGITDAVRFTGYLGEEELIALYRQAAVFAFPSLYEGFGLPVVEAMACGAPVLTSNAASLPEVAGDAAILVDPYSENEIHDGLRRLVEDGDLRAELSARGKLQAARYSWRSTAAQTAEIYARCLS